MTYRPSVPAPPVKQAAIALRCEVTAYALSGSREIVLAHYRATSPRLAARWMRAEAQRLARLLAPEPTTPRLGSMLLVAAGPACPRPDADLLAWAASDARYEHVLGVLRAGNTYTLDVTDYDARYSVRAYALPTHRPSQSPAPTGCRTYVPAGAGHHGKPRRWRFLR
ncbi:hypothetical protein [Streptomyces sp. NPDC001508]|uniref:hypothetical protein n=1 Tax=Streptomyces sp. NPDC001508 TaxID=3154656 RepID=UPI003327A9D5